MFARLQQLLNDETSIAVLNVLVLVMALLWLLTGGFQFLGRRGGKKRNKRGKGDEP